MTLHLLHGMNFSQWAVTPFVWLAVVMTVIPLVVLVVHSVMQHRAILRGVAQQRAREARLRAAQQQEAA